MRGSDLLMVALRRSGAGGRLRNGEPGRRIGAEVRPVMEVLFWFLAAVVVGGLLVLFVDVKEQ
jgi:hypothetical protein